MANRCYFSDSLEGQISATSIKEISSFIFFTFFVGLGTDKKAAYRFKMEEGIAGQALQRKKTLAVSDIRQVHYKSVGEQALRSILTCPIKSGNHVTGTFVVIC